MPREVQKLTDSFLRDKLICLRKGLSKVKREEQLHVGLIKLIQAQPMPSDQIENMCYSRNIRVIAHGIQESEHVNILSETRAQSIGHGG